MFILRFEGCFFKHLNNLIQEFYTEAVIGVTLNDQWFMKFKYR